jgi:hypothetical protein
VVNASRESLPRILIVSVNPLSEVANNGKTIGSFFRGYPKDKIAQMYFHRDVPDSSICDKYFRISDSDMIRFLLSGFRNLGVQVSPEEFKRVLTINKLRSALKRFKFIVFLRSLVFEIFLRLRNKRMRAWIEEFSPQVIFFCGGNANYLYPFVEKLVLLYGVNLVTFVTDDYIMPIQNTHKLLQINRTITRKRLIKVCKKSTLVLSIGEKMEHDYRKQFKIQSIPMMNMVDLTSVQQLPNSRVDRGSSTIQFCYTGGLHLNRWEVLLAIGKSLDRLAESEKFEISLDVFTATLLKPRIRNKFHGITCISFHDPLSAQEVRKLQSTCDFLLHLESFEKKDRDITRYSISTKIPEYIVSGSCTIAVGPDDIASIEYLQKNGLAIVINRDQADYLDKCFGDIIANKQLRDEVIDRCSTFARNTLTTGNQRLNFWNLLKK